MSGPIRALAAAFPEGAVGRYKAWLSRSGRQIDEADSQLEPGEEVIRLAFASSQFAGSDRLVVLTSLRLFDVEERRVRSAAWSDMKASTPMTAVGSPRLLVKSRRARFDLWEVRPRHLAKEIARFINSGGLHRPIPPTGVGDAPIVARTRATFLGGAFSGSENGRAGRILLPLKDRALVSMSLDAAGLLRMYDLSIPMSSAIAVYPVSAGVLGLDSADGTARKFRADRTALTVAGAALLSPLALAGLIASTERVHKAAFLLTIDDPPDYGAFSVADQAFAYRMLALRSGPGPIRATARELTPGVEGAPNDQSGAREFPQQSQSVGLFGRT